MNLVGLGLFVAVLGAVIVRQVLGRGPPIWTVFGVGAILALLTEALSPAEAGQALLAAAPVLLFLLALFLFAAALERSGALDHLARWLVGRARTPESLPAVLFVGFGVASAFIVNDALILIAIPILFSVGRRLRIDPKPLLLTVAFAVTVGSTLTPLGNPQNLLVSVSSGISAPITMFLRFLIVPVLASLVLGGWYLVRVFRHSMHAADDGYPAVRAAAPPLFPEGGWGARLRRSPVLLLFPATLVVLIGLDVSAAAFGTPDVAVWIPALIGSAIVVAASPGRAALLRSVNGRILLLFVGLFLVVATAEAAGLIAGLGAVLPIPGPSNLPGGIAGIVGTSVVGSQLVSNVPWVALQIPVLSGLGYTGAQPVAWLALAAGSTLAGNVTLLGAASNLILVERAEQLGIRIRLGEFMRYALPIAALSIGLTWACLAAGV